MTPFFAPLTAHMHLAPHDESPVIYHMLFQLKNPPIHMQTTAKAENK